MTRPPALATLLLALAPPEYRAYLAGDLAEEFARQQNPRRWYWKQVARSLPGFLALRARGSDWDEALTVLLVTAGWLVVGWHFLWSFILSQIPLKADRP
jgi:hypothetical protein